ncbi:ATP-binding protein [Thermomonospora cellulosilytica]|uniref:Anti-sigma regulatory factor (Ser/Thr protein kinase) n=1 Tax=Thermomonospora cellulosilytica TaxID=1411118 RepID=A0A7W3MTE7_9ACTN|nr:ATP-binding protein [Thermomonospora cellulosilytica]MBA9001572.1 anti-sigma regulatory factor (Ser/Thr protein kinase) [Thermomonospora cellulosilytica]
MNTDAGTRSTGRRKTTRTIGAAVSETSTDEPEHGWRVDLPGTAEAVSLLRGWVRLVLTDVPQHVDAFELIASEYGTNALWHTASGGPGGRIRVELGVTADRIRLAVHDDGAPTASSKWAPECPDDHGRGLMLVAALADEHGRHATPTGHVAWAAINR